MVELAGYDVPEHCDGTSVVSLIDNPTLKRKQSALTSFEFNRSTAIYKKEPVIGHALRSEHYRYIYYENKGLEELYDHESDPNEFENIAYRKNQAKIVNYFREELISRVDGLTIEEINEVPKGYSIIDGKPEDLSFKTMDDLPFNASAAK